MDNNEEAYEQRLRFGMASEVARLSDEISRLTENQRLQDSATAAVMERAEKAKAELAACREDADRLDWLEQQVAPDLIFALVVRWTYNGKKYPTGMRDAIDAAREGGA